MRESTIADTMTTNVPADILTQAFLEVVVTRVIESRAQLTKDTRTHLNRTIKQSIKSQGFRDASAQPATVLRPRVIQRMLTVPPLLFAVVDAWAELESELRTAIEQHLREVTHNRDVTDDTPLDDWLRHHVDHLETRLPAHDADAVRLMLFHLRTCTSPCGTRVSR